MRLLLLLLVLLTACTKAPQNQDAVRQAVLEHLGKRSDMLAQSMKIEVVSVNFRDKEADAVVSVSPKEGGSGIQMNYSLVVENGKWVVKPSASSNPHGGSMMPSGEMPAGHPPVGSKAHP